MATIASPCNKTCIIEPVSKLCLGCGRNLAEIERWTRLTDRERADVMAQLPQRLASLSARRATPPHSGKDQGL
jgi:predicted Fe-S protein YdhL (DUF1289 family)